MILSVYPLPLITYTHDASASLIGDEGVLYAYEEEKLSRFQYSISDSPERSSVIGLNFLGVQPEDIDRLVITSMEDCGIQPGYERKVQYVKDLFSLRDDTRVDCVQHHLAHTALAVLTSPFEECLFLTMDAGGDGYMGHWGIFRDNKFEVIEHFELSPAILYAYITCLTGFSIFEEGKVMGLSGYGRLDENLYDWLKQTFFIERGQAGMRVSEGVALEWDSALRPELADADTLRRHKYFRLGVRFSRGELAGWLADLSPVDVAFTGQKFFEDLIIEAATNIAGRTVIKNIALGGGAFQNIVLNGKLGERTGLNTYVSMAPHDAGLSLGAGLLIWHRETGRRPEYPLSPHLGPGFGSREIEDLIDVFSLSHERPADLCGFVAERIARGEVIGWFQGRAEFGARALGARSVLADPRSPEAKSKVNQNLKKRDWFMPYAPSILEEYGVEYFENFSPSPYMNTAFRVRQGKAESIPSAVHVDGSCRAHSVNARHNFKYHQLITRFHSLTGIPMILNTSFNRHGVPIVATPRQAIQHLLEGNVDLLAIEDFIIYRKYLPRRLASVRGDEYHFGWLNLQFSAGALSRGRRDVAQREVDKLGLSVTASAGALEVGGEPFWSVGEPEEKLRSWWDGVWEESARKRS